MSDHNISLLQNLISQIHDSSRSKRIINQAIDWASDQIELQSIKTLKQEFSEVLTKTNSPIPQQGKLMTTRQAYEYLSKGERTFRSYVASGLIKPFESTTLRGERHRFAKSELDRFLGLSSGEVRSKLALFKASRARKARPQAQQ